MAFEGRSRTMALLNIVSRVMVGLFTSILV